MPELTRRYVVMAMATEGPFDTKDVETPFVLKPWKDPSALAALRAYRDSCYPELAAELTRWIDEIGSGPRVLGGVGSRNAQHLAGRARGRAKTPARTAKRRPQRARPKARTKVAGRKARRRKSR